MAERLRRSAANAVPIAALWEDVRERTLCLQPDPLHDHGHLRRVWGNASGLAEQAVAFGDWTVDLDILEVACALHELGRGTQQPGENLEEASAREADALLRAHGLGDLVWPVCEAILSLGRGAARPPETAEARLLADGNRLDDLGAIGVARALVGAAQRGVSGLCCAEDPGGLARALDTTRYVLDRFPAELFGLAGEMCTPFGRDEAQRRLRLVKAFHEAVMRDCGALAGGGD